MIVLNGGSYYPDSREVDSYWISKVEKDDLIIFVPSATSRSQKEYYEFFKQNMSNYNLKNIEYVDLYLSWERALEAKVIYIPGGNTYKLIGIIRKSGFDGFLKVETENKIIVGNSAGAVVLGQEVQTSNDEDVIGIQDKKGVGLVGISICPHYTDDKKDRLTRLSKTVTSKIVGVGEKSGIIFDQGNVTKVGYIREF